MKIKSIKNIKSLENSRVLWRVDFNVPMTKGRVDDDYKIIRHMPTLNFLLKKKCKIIIVTHLGRPEPGQDNGEFSTKPLAKRLSKILGQNVEFVDDCVGLKAGTAVANMKGGDILMLQNIRFESEEEKNSKALAKKLSRLADIYVNDAFAVSHRAHSSVSAIMSYLPPYAGLLLEGEISSMQRALKPRKPMILVAGGAKVETKVGLLDKLGNKSSKILVGGALANNFLAARGFNVGKSKVDKESIALAKKILRKDKKGVIILPIDALVSKNEKGRGVTVKNIAQIDKDDYIFDIGPATLKFYSDLLKKAKTIIWNGPMGMFELPVYREGTISLARVMSDCSSRGAFVLVGGGETEEAMKESGKMEKVDWVSTGGGAMLSYLGGEKMPGLKIIVK